MLCNVKRRLSQKLPKLEAASCSLSSVLVLELTEVALTTEHTVFDCYRTAMDERRLAGDAWEPDWVVIAQLHCVTYGSVDIVKSPSGYRPIGAETTRWFETKP